MVNDLASDFLKNPKSLLSQTDMAISGEITIPFPVTLKYLWPFSETDRKNLLLSDGCFKNYSIFENFNI